MKKDILFLILFFIAGALLLFILIDTYNSQDDSIYKSILFYGVSSIAVFYMWFDDFLTFVISLKNKKNNGEKK